MPNYVRNLTTLALTISVTILGCANADPPKTTGETGTSPVEDNHSAHAHPSEGPHHGPLIELGAEEYHAELLHDENSGKVTIYVLDKAATASVPIAASEIMINLKHNGKGQQFKLAAMPLEGEADGVSSRFISEDKTLGDLLHNEETEATLAISINGKPYRGKVPHHHDHGHDHAH